MQKIITIVALTLVIFFSTININSDALAETAINLDRGAAVFKANCAGCHAKGGNIVRRGKNLKLRALHKNKVDTEEAIALLVKNGKNNMSAYGDKLSDEEIADVSAYVLQRAEEKWK
ncbi:c-type cytochrome [Pleurocapsa sp. PCC 7319]|uniref:c-type cytochrome n=1 Tax=Pleurocapsa sp. PCC 7319 TaxID=118161 RepID=UPI00034BBEB0|nr:c-type cytochrome [Pleurocapsa sp. PCC 7319]